MKFRFVSCTMGKQDGVSSTVAPSTKEERIEYCVSIENKVCAQSTKTYCSRRADPERNNHK